MIGRQMYINFEYEQAYEIAACIDVPWRVYTNNNRNGTKKETRSASLSDSRGEKTRTSGLYVPNVARYQLRYTPP